MAISLGRINLHIHVAEQPHTVRAVYLPGNMIHDTYSIYIGLPNMTAFLPSLIRLFSVVVVQHGGFDSSGPEITEWGLDVWSLGGTQAMFQQSCYLLLNRRFNGKKSIRETPKSQLDLVYLVKRLRTAQKPRPQDHDRGNAIGQGGQARKAIYRPQFVFYGSADTAL